MPVPLILWLIWWPFAREKVTYQMIVPLASAQAGNICIAASYRCFNIPSFNAPRATFTNRLSAGIPFSQSQNLLTIFSGPQALSRRISLSALFLKQKKADIHVPYILFFSVLKLFAFVRDFKELIVFRLFWLQPLLFRPTRYLDMKPKSATIGVDCCFSPLEVQQKVLKIETWKAWPFPREGVVGSFWRGYD